MREIKATTKTIGLIGNPISHSFSPIIHNNLSEISKIDAKYLAFDVEKETLSAAIKGAHALGIYGLNVTVPHKEEVIPHLSYVDPIAKKIGAVNTLVYTKDGYAGYNTDILGFKRQLEENKFKIQDCVAVILGAGGVSRAISFLFANEGAKKIYILNRTKESAKKLSIEINTYFKKDVAIPLFLNESESINDKDFVFVQTTNVGMFPNVDEVLIPHSKLYKNAALGFDVIYNPYTTKFMRILRDNGIRAVNGLPMLFYQALFSYKNWFDVTFTQAQEKSVYFKLKNAVKKSTLEQEIKELDTNKNIVLVGFMGSGKTTLGKWIAKKTGRALIDTDKEIEKRLGKTINEIFSELGEEAFRNIETEVLKDLATKKSGNLVLSVGGGTPLRKENREMLKKIGYVVYLRASAKELIKRLKNDEKRPLLKNKDYVDRYELIKKLLFERDNIYIDAANFVVRTDGVYFPRIYQIILKRLLKKPYIRQNKYKNKYPRRNNGKRYFPSRRSNESFDS